MDKDSKLSVEHVFESLTLKQRQTIELLADGRTSKEIASELDISESAAVQRIETLRAKAGGVLRKELARLYREYSDNCRDACKEVTGNKNHLPPISSNSTAGTGTYTGSVLTMNDAVAFERPAPWASPGEPEVVPEALEGENAALNRWLAAVFTAVGMVVLMLVLLAVASELGTLF